MKITNIIAAYNRKDNLEAHLKYIENQTFKDFEVIICDDGSTDGTLEMVLNLKTSYPLTIFTTKSYDICQKAKALNMGIRAAKGNILVFHDDDSWPHKNCFEEYAKTVKGGIVVLGQQPLTREVLGMELPLKPLYKKARYRQELSDQGLLNGKWLIGNNFACWREDAIKIGMFNEEFEGYGFEDTEFGRRLEKICKFIFNPNAATWHNNKDTSYTPEQRKSYLKKSKELYLKLASK